MQVVTAPRTPPYSPPSKASRIILKGGGERCPLSIIPPLLSIKDNVHSLLLNQLGVCVHNVLCEWAYEGGSLIYFGSR